VAKQARGLGDALEIAATGRDGLSLVDLARSHPERRPATPVSHLTVEGWSGGGKKKKKNSTERQEGARIASAAVRSPRRKVRARSAGKAGGMSRPSQHASIGHGSGEQAMASSPALCIEQRDDHGARKPRRFRSARAGARASHRSPGAAPARMPSSAGSFGERSYIRCHLQGVARHGGSSPPRGGLAITSAIDGADGLHRSNAQATPPWPPAQVGPGSRPSRPGGERIGTLDRLSEDDGGSQCAREQKRCRDRVASSLAEPLPLRMRAARPTGRAMNQRGPLQPPGLPPTSGGGSATAR